MCVFCLGVQALAGDQLAKSLLKQFPFAETPIITATRIVVTVKVRRWESQPVLYGWEATRYAY